MNLPNKTLLHGGTYRIVGFIGRGGFGCTYKAEHVLLQKQVAIKEFFVSDYCGRDRTSAYVVVEASNKRALIDRLRGKFLDEARAISRMSHSNIVKVTDVFEENGTAYYVMDYIEGKSLEEIVRKGALPEQRAVRYITQVASALKYVHSCNRLHLDVKPGNIMIDKNDNAVLIDFGTSKQYDEVGGANTSTILGHSPGYAPIEQLGNSIKTFTPSADIYALGATLYKLLTGVAPRSADILASGEKLVPLPNNVSPNVALAIHAAMQTSKNDRPQTVDAFLAILNGAYPKEETVLDESDAQSVEQPTSEPSTPEKSNTLDKVEKTDKPQKPKGGRKFFTWKRILLLVFLLFCVISVVLIIQNKDFVIRNTIWTLNYIIRLIS